MMLPERMAKLFVVGPKSRLPSVVGKLHELRIAHIMEHKKDKHGLCGPLDSFDRISGLLVQARSLMSHLEIGSGESSDAFQLPGIAGIEKQLSGLREEVMAFLETAKAAEDENARISEQLPVLRKMELLGVSPADYSPSKHLKKRLGTVQDTIPLRSRLLRVTDSFEMRKAESGKESGGRSLVAVFADARHAEKIDALLSESGFQDIDISRVIGMDGQPSSLIGRLQQRQQELKASSENTRKKMRSIALKHGKFLQAAESFLAQEADKGQAPLGFGATRETFFLRCFVPQQDVGKAKSELLRSAKGALHITEEPLGDEEEIPIKLRNSPYVKNYEFFTRLFALPKYSEFDPSILMAFTFPLFYGFMLGDVVYGIITFALFYSLRRKFPIGKDFFNMLLAASVSAMVFGVLYGEYAGVELYHLWIERTHDFDALMSLSVIAGLVHVNFGLLLGFILEYRHHGLVAAATHKLSWMVLQIGGVLFLGPLLGMLAVPQPLFYLGIALFIAAVAMLYKAEGFIGVMEMPSILTHIMSYARLMAVGLASVFIAVMVNDLVTFLFHKGVLFWPLALISLVIGHTFNIALGILSPSLHSVRLHYVEFFSKFYVGGGREYEPFGAEKQKSLI